MNKPTNLVQRAKLFFPEFEERLQRVHQLIVIQDLSERTFQNYTPQLSKVVLEFGCMPEDLSDDVIQDFLYQTSVNDRIQGWSTKKMLICALRFYFRAIGQPARALILPKNKTEKRIPKVLSERQVKKLILAPVELRHRVLLATLYGLGLRAGELLHVVWSDINFDRKQVIIRKTKGGDQRILPLGKALFKGLLALKEQACCDYVFASPRTRVKPSFRSIQWILSKAMNQAGLDPQGVSPHVLRHTYATHLLEMGLDIHSVKHLLGHVKIETTLVYLHVAQIHPKSVFSPVDVILGERKRSSFR
jgi:site-specific recombinase XerD